MGYRFRLARHEECALLPDIERAAAQAFREYAHVTGLDDAALERTNSIDDFTQAQSDGTLWVIVTAGDTPVGFALLHRHGDALHLHEFDVHPAHGRRGLGRALVSRIIEWAREREARTLTLTTYRDVPWNAPFYRRMGFIELAEAEWTPALLRVREQERRNGWRLESRVAMQLLLSG